LYPKNPEPEALKQVIEFHMLFDPALNIKASVGAKSGGN